MCSASDAGAPASCRGGRRGRATRARACRALRARLACQRGQATVEAAFALPVLMLLVLLLLQPAVVLYDRIVMAGAAAEGCRLLATHGGSQEVCEDYVRRRLSAVPEVDVFHVHRAGCTWDVSFSGDESAQTVGVRISTEVRPLPLLDMGASLLGLVNERGNVLVEVESHMDVQPEWVDASVAGASPADWIRSWA